MAVPENCSRWRDAIYIVYSNEISVFRQLCASQYTLQLQYHYVYNDIIITLRRRNKRKLFNDVVRLDGFVPER